MSQPKKFGAFSGVFTPSLLTILGVIMYMRLGWVVGHGGLITTLVIILLAHVVSITTGLSVSSIATDKKIRAGGIYYILSRSLGLPMGGAIGITLFVGTALSISLYLIGFAESFLSIDAVREFLHLSQDSDSYRIIGTAAILILVTIAFISTSLAIRAQYYIMAAIFLSLVSIVAGIFIHPEVHPAAPLLSPSREGLSPEILFAVFFPAVTGFTAGIAMSGDLKNPNSDIPRGTLAAIAVGLLVYTGLAFAFAWFVDRDILINDTNFLLRIAWFSPLVIAGIWGATLSSALGGILGGPRILQAIASDDIGPKVFAKGYGINNEPRNALILIFLIAEAGILIGELNVIAGIVSMFYLASYGFINLAFFLESYASTDFRPTFRVKRWVGLTGFVFAFAIMFKIDMLSMLAALIIVGGIYFWLKQRQIKLEYGDVWQSVLTRLLRSALSRMEKSEVHQRNWQPNMILFSGGTSKRPHLIELAQNLTGAYGIVSNFDLVEDPDARVLFPKNQQAVAQDHLIPGIFTRRQTVKDLYSGIETIARTYGFSGLEPNTVMMGWSRQTKDPARFTRMLNTIYDLDLNLIVLGFDQRYHYREYQSVDIWITGTGRYNTLALTLVRLLLQSEKWEKAKVRLCIVNPQNDRIEIIRNKAARVLDMMRLAAEIRVINNQIEKKPLYQLVAEESEKTALVILEMPPLRKRKSSDFIQETNTLLEKIGTAALLRASTSFDPIDFEIEQAREEPLTPAAETKSLVKLEAPPQNHDLAQWVNNCGEVISTILSESATRYLSPWFDFHKEQLLKTTRFMQTTMGQLAKRWDKLSPSQRKVAVVATREALYHHLQEEFKLFIGKLDDETENLISPYLSTLISSRDKLAPLALKQVVTLTAGDLERMKKSGHPLRAALLCLRYSALRKKKSVTVSLSTERLVNRMMIPSWPGICNDVILSFYQDLIRLLFAKRKLLLALEDSLNLPVNLSVNDIRSYFDEFDNIITSNRDEQLAICNNAPERAVNKGLQSVSELLSEISLKFDRNLYYHGRKIPRRTEQLHKTELEQFAGLWKQRQEVLLGTIASEAGIMIFESKLRKYVIDAETEVSDYIGKKILRQAEQAIAIIQKLESTHNRGQIAEILSELKFRTPDDTAIHNFSAQVSERLFQHIRNALSKLPGEIKLFSESTLNELTNNLFAETEIVEFPLEQRVEREILYHLIEPLVQKTRELTERIVQPMIRINNAVRLVRISSQESFAADPLKPAGGHDFPLDTEFLERQEQQCNKWSQEISAAYDEWQKEARRLTKEAIQSLSLYRMLRESPPGKLPNGTRKIFLGKDANRPLNQVKFLKKLDTRLNSYKKALKESGKQESQTTIVNIPAVPRVASEIRKLYPSRQTLDQLPFYYLQLFTGKKIHQPELWTGSEIQVRQIRQSFRNLRSGMAEAVMVTGERMSGKSFLVKKALDGFVKSPVFTINIPSNRQATPELFDQLLSEETGIPANATEILNELSEHAVIFIDDLELWWEQTESGHQAVAYILKQIEQFSHKHLFIVTCHQYTAPVIGRQTGLDSLFTVWINMQPFDPGLLRKLILDRNNTTGLAVEFKVKSLLAGTAEQRYFKILHRSSEGNPGYALFGWIGSIESVRKEILSVGLPPVTDIQMVDLLNTNLKESLVALFLHKAVTPEKLARILRSDTTRCMGYLSALEKSGLVKAGADGVFEINPWATHTVSSYYKTKFLKS
ncbi:MAG: hypothetical protein Kow00127_15730 [Bacteroidales bacterium]